MALAFDNPLPRPLPPSRTKRNSSVSPSLPLDPVSSINGVLGGLREKSEEELCRASRQALEGALRAAWEQHEQLGIQLEDLEEGRRRVDAENLRLAGSVSAIQLRYDEAMNEQSRLEADLEGRDEILDRLRGRASEAERLAREAAKRALEQEKSFEAERQALQVQEAHLQHRIRYLMSTRPSAPSLGDARTVSDLQEELATLNISHSTILAQLNTLGKEVQELRTNNKALKEENEGWEVLLRERTLNGKVREGGLLGTRYDTDHEEGYPRGCDEEAEMDELHSELDAQSPVCEGEHGFVKDLDREGMLSQSPLGVSLSPPKAQRKRSQGKNLDDLLATKAGLDLAAELGRAEADPSGSEMQVLGKGDEREALRAEVKNLREENKALTLYCSKIIDRIIAQEGFEHILSVDYKTRRIGSRNASGTGRGSLKDITNAMQASAPVAEEVQAEPVKEEKQTRPLSLMVRAMSSGVGKPTTPSIEVGPAQDTAESTETKTEKRARRGFSLDFRSLGFGSSSTTTTPTEQKSNPALKPLTLSPRASPITAPSKPIGAKKLERHDEDEDDRRERHHLEATLKLMGVDRLTGVSNAPAIPSALGKKESTSHPPSSRPGSRESSHRGTPLSRLSSAIGSNDSPLCPLSPEITALNLSPESAAEAALKAFDQKEAELVKALSKGEAVSGYTSPTSGSVRRRSGGRRAGSGDSVRSASSRIVEAVEGLEEGHASKIRESGSVGTL